MGPSEDTAPRAARPGARALLRFLWKDLRLEKPWRYKAPFLFTALYFQAARGAFDPSLTLTALWASIGTIAGIAGLAYLSNDFADQDADARAGKPNAARKLGARRVAILAVAFLALALVPWALVLPLTPESALLLVLEFALIAAYAFPPLRLKERGFPGIVADALYAHALPAVLATMTYFAMARNVPIDSPFLLSLGLWQFALGVRNITLHQLLDHENDQRAAVPTWVARNGPLAAERWLRRVFVPLELCGFAGFLWTVSALAPWTAPAFATRLLFLNRRNVEPLWRSPDLRSVLYSGLDTFYLQWLPPLILGAAILRDPAFTVVLVLHMLLSPDLAAAVGRPFASRRTAPQSRPPAPAPSSEPRRIATFEDVGRSRAFCMKPWVHLFVSQKGTVAPCCLTPWDREQALGEINDEALADIWNGAPMRELRLKMLRDEPDARCRGCYEREAVGLSSARLGTNFYHSDKLDWAFDTEADGSSSKARPVDLDIRISNLCNLKCRICGHDSSSEWYEDARALGHFTYDQKVHRGLRDFERLFAQLEPHLPFLEELYLAGGEPSVSDETYRILNRLIDMGRTNIRILYVTNFAKTEHKGQDLFEILNHFEDVTVLASLDDRGERVELQRHGLRFDVALENRRRMMRVAPRARICVSATASVFNVMQLPAFHKEWVREGLIRIDEFMPHVLMNPPEYSMTVLPAALKTRVREEFEAHIAWIIDTAKTAPPRPEVMPAVKRERTAAAVPWVVRNPITGHGRLDASIQQFRGCVSYLMSRDDTHLLPRFRESCARLDALRGEDTRAVFPELRELWEEAAPS